MVDRNELFAVADAMVQDGVTPSVRTVRSRLANGGSPNEIASMLRDWEGLRAGGEAPEVMMPAAIRDRVQALMITFWSSSVALTRAAVEGEINFARKRAEFAEGLVDELTAVAEGRDDLIGALRGEVDDLRARLTLERQERKAAEDRLKLSELAELAGVVPADRTRDGVGADVAPVDARGRLVVEPMAHAGGVKSFEPEPAGSDLRPGKGIAVEQAERIILQALTNAAPDPVGGAALNKLVEAVGLKKDRAEAAKVRLKGAGLIVRDPSNMAWRLGP